MIAVPMSKNYIPTNTAVFIRKTSGAFNDCLNEEIAKCVKNRNIYVIIVARNDVGSRVD